MFGVSAALQRRKALQRCCGRAGYTCPRITAAAEDKFAAAVLFPIALRVCPKVLAGELL